MAYAYDMIRGCTANLLTVRRQRPRTSTICPARYDAGPYEIGSQRAALPVMLFPALAVRPPLSCARRRRHRRLPARRSFSTPTVTRPPSQRYPGR